MPINFQTALGVHEQALKLRSQRAEVLANNIANADTPGYKAKDLDFKSILAAESGSSENLRVTHNKHMNTNFSEDGSPELLFKNPNQPSVDGNTVEVHQEKAEYLRNSLEFQTSFRFLNGKFKGLKSAIRGD